MQNKEYQKLRKCPFCGGEADIFDNSNEEVNYRAFGYGIRGYPTWYKCYCKECGATGSTVHIEKGCENNKIYEKWAKEKAIEAWNRREGDPE